MQTPSAAPLHYAILVVLMTSIGACHAKEPATADNSAAPSTDSALEARIQTLLDKTRKDMVFVEGGTFTMGDFGPVHNADKLPYSGPTNDDVLREVTLDSYSIGAYKVTYAEFDLFTEAAGRPKVAQDPLDLEYRDLPGTPAGVNWYDAQAYCQWVGEQLSVPMDLPTEAQWEYAARSRGEMVVYPTDNGEIEDGRNVASYDQYKEFTGRHGLIVASMPIGQYPPNPLGLYDLIDHGFEWVQDWYAPEYDINDTRNPKGPATGTEKVQRAHSDWGGDSLFIVSMTVTRFHKHPNPPPNTGSDGQPMTSNQNAAHTFRCAVNAQDRLNTAKNSQ